MLKIKLLSVVAAASLLSLGAFSSAFAEPIPAEEAQQLSNVAAPDIDPGASMGADASIVQQEEQQIGNSTEPSVPERAEQGGEPITKMEQDGLQ